MQAVFLLTDLFVWAIVLFVIWYAWRVHGDHNLRVIWTVILRRPVTMVSSMILGFFILIALTDSIHFRLALSPTMVTSTAQYSSEATSLLDVFLQPLASARERSYSEPLSAVGFRKETFERDGLQVRDYPRLRFGGKHLEDPAAELSGDIAAKSWSALGFSVCIISRVKLLSLFIQNSKMAILNGHGAQLRSLLRQWSSSLPGLLFCPRDTTFLVQIGQATQFWFSL
jgi:peptide/nickel transport system permease protein